MSRTNCHAHLIRPEWQHFGHGARRPTLRFPTVAGLVGHRSEPSDYPPLSAPRASLKLALHLRASSPIAASRRPWCRPRAPREGARLSALPTLPCAWSAAKPSCPPARSNGACRLWSSCGSLLLSSWLAVVLRDGRAGVGHLDFPPSEPSSRDGHERLRQRSINRRLHRPLQICERFEGLAVLPSSPARSASPANRPLAFDPSRLEPPRRSAPRTRARASRLAFAAGRRGQHCHCQRRLGNGSCAGSMRLPSSASSFRSSASAESRPSTRRASEIANCCHGASDSQAAALKRTRSRASIRRPPPAFVFASQLSPPVRGPLLPRAVSSARDAREVSPQGWRVWPVRMATASAIGNE